MPVIMPAAGGLRCGMERNPIGKIHAAPREYDGRNVTVSGRSLPAWTSSS
jgi:hypothetical protein